MPGPSWFARQGVKAAFKYMGASSAVAAAAGYTASTATSLIFHDHHTHLVPDADHVADAARSLGDTIDVADHSQSLHEHASTLHEHASTSRTHFGSYDTGTYDTSSGTATFPDGTVVQHPYEDASGQVYKTKDDWVNGSDPYVVEKT